MAFDLDNHISKTPGFPKEGITFYDISPALEDAEVLTQLMAALRLIQTTNSAVTPFYSLTRSLVGSSSYQLK